MSTEKLSLYLTKCHSVKACGHYRYSWTHCQSQTKLDISGHFYGPATLLPTMNSPGTNWIED